MLCPPNAVHDYFRGISGPHAEVAQEVAPAAAALAVLPAAFAAEEARLQMLRALLELALGMEDNFAASTVAAAAASAINKTPKGAQKHCCCPLPLHAAFVILTLKSHQRGTACCDV